MIQWKTAGTRLYQALPKEMYESCKPTEPLQEIPSDRPAQKTLYKTWNELRDKDVK